MCNMWIYLLIVICLSWRTLKTYLFVFTLVTTPHTMSNHVCFFVWFNLELKYNSILPPYDWNAVFFFMLLWVVCMCVREYMRVRVRMRNIVAFFSEKQTLPSLVCEVLCHSSGVWFSFNEMEVNEELASLHRGKQKKKRKEKLMLISVLLIFLNLAGGLQQHVV